MMSQATQAQNRASHPTRSTWVSANAGSGKTRVLTDRVARLLLNDQLPDKILCLTYTKAAAAEMQNRLFRRLGEWAMMEDGKLRAALSEIGENGENYTDAALSRTRTHFARALETPGGLKIQTIHAFCASLLRRFPIEAGVSPQFRELDEGQSEGLRTTILDEMAREDYPVSFDTLARHLTDEGGLDRLLLEILKKKDDFAAFDRALLAKKLGISEADTEEDLEREAMGRLAFDLSEALVTYLSQCSTQKEKTAGAAMALALKSDPRHALSALESGFLKKDKTLFAGGVASSKTKKEQTGFAETLDRISEQLLSAREKILGVRALDRTRDLHPFARDFIDRYEAEKERMGVLDFDDLIARTRSLLSARDMTAWVLYRIDNGIKHILVDEAQDTSPRQWELIQSLSEDFTSGESSGPQGRTLFVVGDKKQSIFGFQGADPDEFDTMQEFFASRLQQVGQVLERTDMETSFRSAPPILRLVDQVFSQDRLALGGPPKHIALESTPGRVDLWPFIEKEKNSDDREWWEPVDRMSGTNPVFKLAIKTANFIKEQIESGTLLHTKDGSRPVQPGDFLVLVRSRSPFFHTLIDALKSNQVEVAGADRMKIGSQLAVRDLMSLLRFLDNELDDLSLAETLRSPIFCVTEAELFGFAHNRPGSLWSVLAASDHPSLEIILALRKELDFVRPYEVLNRVLTEFGARSRFIARLGEECEDAIDEVLAQSIVFESSNSPSLGGFLEWMSARDIEIKRDMEAGRNQVRVMTVHGSKGLEAPIVILPDTSVFEPARKKPQVGQIDDIAVWTQTAAHEPAILKENDGARKDKEKHEYARLLYVALTRAENWLIVSGAGQIGKDKDRWYTRISEAMGPIGAEMHGDISTKRQGWEGQSDTAPPVPHKRHPLEPWAHQKPKAFAERPKPVAPSSYDGPHALPGDYIEDGTKRGDIIHRLLEVLPTRPKTTWADLSKRLCEDLFDPSDILEEVTKVIEHPDLEAVFAQDVLVEVPITATLEERHGELISGRIDRLLVGENRLLAVDFKSNPVVPERVEEIPKALLAQQGAYAAALLKLYPDHTVETAIIWTKTATMMTLPHGSVMNALKTVTTS